jgi:hypothetical protein
VASDDNLLACRQLQVPREVILDLGQAYAAGLGDPLSRATPRPALS